MRNLQQYPITPDECLQFLQETRISLAEQSVCGSNNMILIDYIQEFLANNSDFQQFVIKKG